MVNDKVGRKLPAAHFFLDFESRGLADRFSAGI